MGEQVGPQTIRGEVAATSRLAVPLAVANVMAMAVHSIDIVFVARLGQEALAAASLAMSAFWFINYGITGVVSALAAVLAAQVGRKFNSVRELRRSFRMGCWLAGTGGLIGLVLSLFAEEFFLFTGQDRDIAERAARFMVILSLSLVPHQLAMVMRIYVSVMGRPIFATMITGMAIIVNVIANYAFVFGKLGAPELGLLGSALASFVTSLTVLVAYTGAILGDRRLRRYRVFGNWWRSEWSRLREILRIGTPIGLTTMAEAGLFTGAAFLMGRIGAAELAAHMIAMQIASFSFQIPYGLSQAATIRVGYHFGAANVMGIAQAGRAVLLVGVGFMILAALCFVSFPNLLMSVYIDPGNPANATLVALTTQYILIAAAFQIFDGTQAVTSGLLRGLQDTRVPMMIAISAYWLIGFATAIWLGLFTPLGGAGVWIGLAVSLVVAALLLARRWSRRAHLNLVPALAQT